VALHFRRLWQLSATEAADRLGFAARRLRSVGAGVLIGSTCLGVAPAVAVDGTWTGATNSDWNTDTNWSPGPTPTNTASFANNGAPTSVSIGNLTSINTIKFGAGAPTYSFTFVTSINQTFNINGAGIINDSSNAPIFGPGPIFFKNSSSAGNAILSTVEFDDSSTAGAATINNTNVTGTGAEFTGLSSAGNATITTNNLSVTGFFNSSTGGNASITTNSGGRTQFFEQATGGQASFVTKIGGVVDFSFTSGPGSLNQVSAGSISGAGNYFLGGRTSRPAAITFRQRSVGSSPMAAPAVVQALP